MAGTGDGRGGGCSAALPSTGSGCRDAGGGLGSAADWRQIEPPVECTRRSSLLLLCWP